MAEREKFAPELAKRAIIKLSAICMCFPGKLRKFRRTIRVHDSTQNVLLQPVKKLPQLTITWHALFSYTRYNVNHENFDGTESYMKTVSQNVKYHILSNYGSTKRTTRSRNLTKPAFLKKSDKKLVWKKFWSLTLDLLKHGFLCWSFSLITSKR